MPRPVEGPLDQAWAAVYLRHHQLGVLDARILELEGPVRRLFDAENRLRLDERFGERLDEEHEAAPDFAMQGESGLMFSEAALNCLAEAVAQSRDPTRESDRSDSFRDLKRSVERPSDEITRTLGSLLPKMRAANVLVLVPRSVMSVHPPAGKAAGGWIIGPNRRVKLPAFRLWPSDPTADDQAMREALGRDVALPDDIEGDLLAGWAMDEVPDQLSDDSVAQLRRYFRRHNCIASPGEAIRVTRSLIEDCGTALGYPPEDWAISR